MFCNYCREVNPNDAVYCCACGREIGSPLRKDNGRLEVVNERPPLLSPQPVQSNSASNANSTIPNVPATTDSFSAQELEKLDNQELDEFWAAYAKLQIPPSLAVQQEIKRRALLPKQPNARSSESSVRDGSQTTSTDFKPNFPAPSDSKPAPPLSTTPTPTLAASPAGVFRDGKKLFVSRGAQFPYFCIKCGEPARTGLKKTIYWHPSWVVVLIFLGILPYAIAVFLVRTNMVLTLPLCTAHRLKYTNGRRVALATLLVAVLLLLSCIYLPENDIPIPATLGVVGVLASGIIWEIASSLLRADEIDAEKGIFLRASERFLQKCPVRLKG